MNLCVPLCMCGWVDGWTCVRVDGWMGGWPGVSLNADLAACAHSSAWVEWRPLLLYANPLGHRVRVTLFIARFATTSMSRDDYEMNEKVCIGDNTDLHLVLLRYAILLDVGCEKTGGACGGWVGVNNAWTPRWHTSRRGFWSPSLPPFTGPKCLGGVGVGGLHLWTPVVCMSCDFMYSALLSEQCALSMPQDVLMALSC